MTSSGFVHEIFSSVQGEGLDIGHRQIFIRFMGCNLRCAYCDTIDCQELKGPCHIQINPDKMILRCVENPVSIQEVVDSIVALQVCPHHSLSFTGGEPLLQSHFLQEIAWAMRKRGTRIFLETNGTLLEEFKECQDDIDSIGMDWKDPASSRGRDLTDEHLQFLKLAARKDVFVKIVVSAAVDIHEFRRICALVSSVKHTIPLVIQPVFPTRGIEPPSTDILLRLHSIAAGYLDEVRVIPQVHKYLMMR